MAKEKLEVIKEAELQNNCPECFNKELKLTFYQKHLYGSMYHKTTGEITNQIKCSKCGSSIYPAKWTDDIERIFDYYQKMISPEKASMKFTNLFYAVLVLFIVLVGVGTYLYVSGTIQF